MSVAALCEATRIDEDTLPQRGKSARKSVTLLGNMGWDMLVNAHILTRRSQGSFSVDTDLNHCTLTGVLERDPITRFADHGTQQVSFTLRLIEAGPAWKEFKLYVPIEAYSGVAEHADELRQGDSVLVAGKLKWTSYTAKDGSKKNSLCG